MRAGWIVLTNQHAKAAIFCARYLTSKPFSSSEEGSEFFARLGYYGFQDYAAQHCLDHLQQCAEDKISCGLRLELMDTARCFLESYFLSAPKDLAEMSAPGIGKLLSQLPKDKRERAEKFNIGQRALCIRSVVEKLRSQIDLSPEDKETISNVYGVQVTYKCPKIWCYYFSTGFGEEGDRKEHVCRHDRPYRCTEPNCFAFEFGFASESKLGEHMTNYHKPTDGEERFLKAVARPKDDTILEAADRNDLTALREFMNSGVSRDGSYKGRIDYSPLFRAAKNGHVEACKLLLEKGARYLPRNEGNSPLKMAILKNHVAVVRFLLNWPKAVKSSWQRSWARDACETANLDMLRAFLESSKYMEWAGPLTFELTVSWWIRPAQRANSQGAIDIVHYMLEKGYSQFFDPESLFIAEDDGFDDLANFLRPIIDLYPAAYVKDRKEAWLLDKFETQFCEQSGAYARDKEARRQDQGYGGGQLR